jgi:hypothetical protein
MDVVGDSSPKAPVEAEHLGHSTQIRKETHGRDEQIAASAQELSQNAEQVGLLVAQFKIPSLAT